MTPHDEALAKAKLEAHYWPEGGDKTWAFRVGDDETRGLTYNEARSTWSRWVKRRAAELEATT